MKRVYCVVIKGRTLESRDLKELLSRAVAAKRDSDRRLYFQARFHKQGDFTNSANPLMTAGSGIRV